MDQQLKQKWTTALRSGAYEQARSTLVDSPHGGIGVRYCCLAVLLCVSGKYRQLDTTGLHQQYYDVIDGLIGGRNTRDILTAMNDLRNKSFVEIADYVDANL